MKENGGDLPDKIASDFAVLVILNDQMAILQHDKLELGCQVISPSTTWYTILGQLASSAMVLSSVKWT